MKRSRDSTSAASFANQAGVHVDLKLILKFYQDILGLQAISQSTWKLALPGRREITMIFLKDEGGNSMS